MSGEESIYGVRYNVTLTNPGQSGEVDEPDLSLLREMMFWISQSGHPRPGDLMKEVVRETWGNTYSNPVTGNSYLISFIIPPSSYV